MTLKRWRVRASPGFEEEWLEADYSDSELELMRVLKEKAVAGDMEAANCIDTIHELKVLTGATIVEDEPAAPFQPSLFAETDLSRVPDFDGATIDQERDKPRLFPQLLKVGHALLDGEWHTLPDLELRTGAPQASISARLRDFRKPKWGAHTVEREYVQNGLHRYRLLLNPDAVSPLGYSEPGFDE